MSTTTQPTSSNNNNNNNNSTLVNTNHSGASSTTTTTTTTTVDITSSSSSDDPSSSSSSNTNNVNNNHSHPQLNDSALSSNFSKSDPIPVTQLRIDHNKYLLVAGSNKEGQIGLGDSSERINILERIKSPPEFTTAKISSIHCAPLHSIFITSDNEIFICGNNGNCRLGLGEKSADVTKKRIATKITEPEEFLKEHVKQVACGENHTLFLTTKGHVWSCGGNHKGQLGLTIQEAPNNVAKLPTRVTFFEQTRIQMIACGLEHTIFLTEDHKVYSCGAGENGQLGLGNMQSVPMPTLIPTFANVRVIKVECGFYFSVFVTDNNDIYTCGRNHYGQLCQGTVTPLNVPQKIPDNLLPWKTPEQLPLSLTPSLSSDSNNSNSSSSSTSNSNSETNNPIYRNDEEIENIYCGQHHMICVLKSGGIYVGGWNGYGQLGLGDLKDRRSFEKLTFFEQRNTSVRVTTCGAAHSAFITDMNELWLCGYNTAGQLALGHENAKVHTLQRVRHPALKHKRIVDVKCGTVHTIIVTEALKSKNELLRKSVKNMPEMEKLMFDSEIIGKESSSFPICGEFVEIRCPCLGKGPRREVNLSDEAIRILLYYCLSDDLPIIQHRNYQGSPSDNEGSEMVSFSEATKNAFILLEIIQFIQQNDPQPEHLQLTHNRLLFLLVSQLVQNLSSDNAIILLERLSKNYTSTDHNSGSTIDSHDILNLIQTFIYQLLHKSVLSDTFTHLPGAERLQLSGQRHLWNILQAPKYAVFNLESTVTNASNCPAGSLESDMRRFYDNNQRNYGGDVELILDREGKESIRANRVVLASRCDYFKRKFSSGMMDQKTRSVPLYDPILDGDSSNRSPEEEQLQIQVKRQFIRYLYTSEIDIDSSNAVALLNIWNFYCMPINDPVSIQCQEIISDGLNEDNVLPFMHSFLNLYPGVFRDLEDVCVDVCVRNWKVMHDKFSDEELFGWLGIKEYMVINRRFMEVAHLSSSTSRVEANAAQQALDRKNGL